jgi:hypothetical protein
MVGRRSHILNGTAKPTADVEYAAYGDVIMRSVFVLIDCRGEA